MKEEVNKIDPYDLMFIIHRLFRAEFLHLPQSPWITKGCIGIGMMTLTRQNETDHQTISSYRMMMIHDLQLWDFTRLEVIDRSRTGE
jgi:hypothetical protein